MSFQQVVVNKKIADYVLDSNLRPQVSEATALKTELQALHCTYLSVPLNQKQNIGSIVEALTLSVSQSQFVTLFGFIFGHLYSGKLYRSMLD